MNREKNKIEKNECKNFSDWKNWKNKKKVQQEGGENEMKKNSKRVKK